MSRAQHLCILWGLILCIMLLSPVKTFAESPIVSDGSEPSTPESHAPESVLPVSQASEPNLAESSEPQASETESPTSPPLFQSGETQTPVTVSNHLISGTVNLKEENLEEALEDFKAARLETPDSSVAAYFLGITYKKMMDFEAARINLTDAVTLTPAVAEAVIELAEVYYQLGDDDKAMKYLLLARAQGVQPANAAFLKGLILLRKGKNGAAIYSFNKAKSIDAKLTQNADYQIALASLKDGRLGEAKDVFKEIILRDPNADIAQFARQYMDLIAARLKAERELKVAADIQYQYDDNVLLRPGDSSVAADITNEADSATVTILRAEYAPKLSGRAVLKTQYSLYNVMHWKLASHDVMSHNVTLAPGYNTDTGSFSAVMNYNYVMVDDFKYLQTYSLAPTFQFPSGRGHFASVFLKMQKKEYIKPAFARDEDRDSDEWGAGTSWYYLLAENRGFFSLSYAFNHEDTHGTNWQYMGNRLGAVALYPITPAVKFNLACEAYHQDFEDPNTAFKIVRKDKTYTVNSSLSYAITEDIDARIQYVYTRGESNIAVYDFTKNVYSAGLEARF